MSKKSFFFSSQCTKNVIGSAIQYLNSWQAPALSLVSAMICWSAMTIFGLVCFSLFFLLLAMYIKKRLQEIQNTYISSRVDFGSMDPKKNEINAKYVLESNYRSEGGAQLIGINLN